MGFGQPCIGIYVNQKVGRFVAEKGGEAAAVENAKTWLPKYNVGLTNSCDATDHLPSRSVELSEGIYRKCTEVGET